MKSPAEIIHRYLLDEGLVTSSGSWMGYISFLPQEGPDNAVVVHDTPGREDGRIMVSGEKIVHPGIQIRVRSLSYGIGWSKMKSIALKLDEVKRVLVALSSEDAYIVHSVSRAGDLIPLGIEVEGDRRRHHFTLNATITVNSN